MKMWKKNLLEKNEFIETSSIKFGEMFFFPPPLFEINFSNISIQCENNKSRKISAFCSELTMYNESSVQINRISDQMKDRI